MRDNESSENYLETILILSKRLPVVRSVDVAEELSVTKPSVSVAMKKLRENDCIVVSKAGFITLTEKGLEIASSIYERHTFISNWLISLGVSEKTAVDDACRMEHYISIIIMGIAARNSHSLCQIKERLFFQFALSERKTILLPYQRNPLCYGSSPLTISRSNTTDSTWFTSIWYSALAARCSAACSRSLIPLVSL